MECIPLFERYEKRKSRNFFLAHTLQKPKFAEKKYDGPLRFRQHVHKHEQTTNELEFIVEVAQLNLKKC